jgi:dihydroneopterin aldolase
MGKIMLNDMIFITRHGACPHEYEFDQKFKVDVWMSTDCVAKADICLWKIYRPE